MVLVGMSASEVLPCCPVVARQTLELWVLTPLEVGPPGLLGTLEVGPLLGTSEVGPLDILVDVLGFVNNRQLCFRQVIYMKC
jgi:hypothetical protein